MIQVHHPSSIHPIADPTPRLLITVSSLTGGASRRLGESPAPPHSSPCCFVRRSHLRRSARSLWWTRMGSIESGEPKSQYTTTERVPQGPGQSGESMHKDSSSSSSFVGRASCLREPDVSDCGRRCIIISPNTSAAPSQWLLGLERHAPPHTHISLSTVMGRSWTPCMQLPCMSCMLHCKLLRGLWGCGDGSLVTVVVIAVPAGRCAVCLRVARPE